MAIDSKSNVDKLLEAGVFDREQVDNFTDEERDVTESMTDENVEHLIRIRKEMNHAASGKTPIVARW
jgi:uncharacterized protein YjcR